MIIPNPISSSVAAILAAVLVHTAWPQVAPPEPSRGEPASALPRTAPPEEATANDDDDTTNDRVDPSLKSYDRARTQFEHALEVADLRAQSARPEALIDENAALATYFASMARYRAALDAYRTLLGEREAMRQAGTEIPSEFRQRLTWHRGQLRNVDRDVSRAEAAWSKMLQSTAGVDPDSSTRAGRPAGGDAPSPTPPPRVDLFAEWQAGVMEAYAARRDDLEQGDLFAPALESEQGRWRSLANMIEMMSELGGAAVLAEDVERLGERDVGPRLRGQQFGAGMHDRFATARAARLAEARRAGQPLDGGARVSSAEALRAQGHAVLFDHAELPDGRGFDLVTKDGEGRYWLVNDRAFSTLGDARTVSSLSRTLDASRRETIASIRARLNDPSQTTLQRSELETIVDRLEAGQVGRAVTNASWSNDDRALANARPRLDARDIRFIDVQGGAAAGTPRNRSASPDAGRPAGAAPGATGARGGATGGSGGSGAGGSGGTGGGGGAAGGGR